MPDGAPVPTADEAARRAEALLARHLDRTQRRAWERDGSVTLTSRGLVGGVLLRRGVAVALGALAAALLPLDPGLPLALLVALPLLSPSVVVACWPRRAWTIDAERGPALGLGPFRLEFCVRLDAPLPEGDRVLAWVNLLRCREDLFLRHANLERVRRARTPGVRVRAAAPPQTLAR